MYSLPPLVLEEAAQALYTTLNQEFDAMTEQMKDCTSAIMAFLAGGNLPDVEMTGLCVALFTSDVINPVRIANLPPQSRCPKQD